MADQVWLVRQLQQLAAVKNQKVEEPTFEAYLVFLAEYPDDLLVRALQRLARDPSPFFPVVGQIIAALAQVLTEQGALLAPDAAWQLARRTIASYQPETRPRPQSGDPAVDATIRDLGGVQACLWQHAEREAVIAKAFRDAYPKHAASAAVVAWAVQGGARLPRPVPGLELPTYEQERLKRAASEQGRALPEPLVRAIAGPPERATLVTSDPAPLPPALLEPATTLTPARREEIRQDVHAAIARIAARLRLPAGNETTEDGS